MPEPYRAVPAACPACFTALRDYRGRLCCDACGGIMITMTDLTNAITEISGIGDPKVELLDEKPGTRRCPRCPDAMTTFKVRVTVYEERIKPRPQLDHCAAHGIWFDRDELAKVFEKVHAKVPSCGSVSARWRGGQDGVPEWWGGGHGNY
jgi:hypothetical protein